MAMDVTATGSKLSQNAPKGAKAGDHKLFFELFKKLPESRFRTTDSGLKVAVLKHGSGKPLTKGKTLTVHYTGWLENGKQFDSSVEKGSPFSFQLGAGNVIKGWEEGMAGIRPGERRQLVIPAALAYGQRKVGEIPAGATLIFNVEAVAVESTRSNPKGNLSLLA